MITKSIYSFFDFELWPRTSFCLPLTAKLALDTTIVVSPVLLPDLTAYSKSIASYIATLAYFHAVSMLETMPLMVTYIRCLWGFGFCIVFHGLLRLLLMTCAMAVGIHIRAASSVSISPLVDPIEHIVSKTTLLFLAIFTSPI